MIPNAPPVEAMGMHIDDLWDEAKGILDGAGVNSDADAEMVAKLLDMTRQAKKDADAQRAVEKKPHDDAAAAVQTAWKPLLAKCDLVTDTCKKALVSYLEAKEAAQRAEAARVAKAAEEARAEALAARQAAPVSDLAAREDAERLDAIARDAEKLAARAGKTKAHATGGSRAIGLRSYWIAELVDPVAALKHYREHQPEALKAWLSEQGQRDASAGARVIPGFAISEERRAA